MLIIDYLLCYYELLQDNQTCDLFIAEENKVLELFLCGHVSALCSADRVRPWWDVSFVKLSTSPYLDVEWSGLHGGGVGRGES